MSPPIRRLALVPEPHPGESLLSWVDALARLNLVGRIQALRNAAFTRTTAVNHRPSIYFGAYVTAETTTRVHTATGLSARRLRRMTLMHYADGVLPAPPHPLHWQTMAPWLNRLGLVLPAQSRACPACLRENGGRWLLRWRLIWSFACVRHRVYLLGTCRECDKGLHQVVPGPTNGIVCGQHDWRHRGRPCPRVISRMRPPRLLDEHLLACQRRLDELVDHPYRPGGRHILETLHLALDDIRMGYDDAPSLPDTDTVLHRRWHGHHGALWDRADPLLTAALIKIATVGGLDASQGAGTQADMASWSADGFPRPHAGAPPINRFGGACRAVACPAWAPPGQGCVVHSIGGPTTVCSAHASHPAAEPHPGAILYRRPATSVRLQDETSTYRRPVRCPGPPSTQ